MNGFIKYCLYKYNDYIKNLTMDNYVLMSEDYLALRQEEIEEAKMLAEGWNPLKIFGRKTGALTSQMLGGTKRMGTETFSTINENVRIIEELIDKWNEEHKDKPMYNGPLALKIDKAKLEKIAPELVTQCSKTVNVAASVSFKPNKDAD